MASSSQIAVLSGVPQRGHLSLRLILIFLFNIDKFCKFELFADVLKIHHTTFRMNDCSKLQDDLNRLENGVR